MLPGQFDREAQPAGRSTGIDLGVNSRVALSDGTLVEGRTPDRRRERRLRRALARSRRGSRGRVKRRAPRARETQRNRGATHELTTALVRATTASPWRLCRSRT